MSKQDFKLPVTRRDFLKTSSACSLAAAAGGVTIPFTVQAATAAQQGAAAGSAKAVGDKVVWNACKVNCGGRCALRFHVSKGQLTWVETDNTGVDEYGDHQVRACLRGRSIRQRFYHPDRLKYPMKRVGKRGEGKFERISWEEAYTLIANSLKETVAKYGNEAVYVNYATGTLGSRFLRSSAFFSLPARLMNCYGGHLKFYNSYSTAQITDGMRFTYGDSSGNDLSDMANTRLIVSFGDSQAETKMSGGGGTYHLAEARRRSGARMIVIDPRYSDTAATHEDEWIPIRPGTDVALCAAIAHVLITENMVDQAFLDKYCVGYDEKTLPASAPKNGHYKAYILGQGDDGIAKTPAWASAITGVPAERIIKLAREIGTTKPCCIQQGWGPQRHSNGEIQVRAIAMLAILTGNVGISGGNSGSRDSSFGFPFAPYATLPNPVKTTISVFMWTDAIWRHHEMTDKTDGVRGAERLKAPIKFIWNYAGNTLINQHSDTNRTHEILSDDTKCEMIVVIENHMTSSAKYADILLPDLTGAEQPDIAIDNHGANMGYLIYCEKATEPMFECKGIYEILSSIAAKLGPEVHQKFTEGCTQEEWLRHLYEQSRAKDKLLPDFDTFRKQGILKCKNPAGHFIAYKKFRDDPKANPLKTPSGKIEIYSEKLAEYARTWKLAKDEVIHPLPVYAPTFEGWDDPLRKELPLQLIGFHHKSRTHSTYGNVEVLKAAVRQEVWINPIDAKPRGIKNGDMVRVFNKRGETRLSAKVTPRIMPGVTAMGQGGWLMLDEKGIDQNGSMNILTTQRPSPLAKGNPQHTNLVEIRKV